MRTVKSLLMKPEIVIEYSHLPLLPTTTTATTGLVVEPFCQPCTNGDGSMKSVSLSSPSTRPSNNNNNHKDTTKLWRGSVLGEYVVEGVEGTLAGQIANPVRARRKQDQLRSMLQCILALLFRTVLVTDHPKEDGRDKEDVPTRGNEEPVPGCDNMPPMNCSDARDVSSKQQRDESLQLTTKEQRWDATLVDFGGGSGHLAIPLACLVPRCRVIVVDLSKQALDLLKVKAKRRQQTRDENEPTHKDSQSLSYPSTILDKHNDQQMDTQNQRRNDDSHRPSDSSEHHRCSYSCLETTSIPNLFTFPGSVEAFGDYLRNPGNEDLKVDVGIALHLCGEATDVALRTCGQIQATALVFCPCCVGKLNRKRKNPYVWQATGQNKPTVTYPQSRLFQTVLTHRSSQDNPQHQEKSLESFQTNGGDFVKEEDWNSLVKAADYGESTTLMTQQASINNGKKSFAGATRRTAKALLETDRRLFLQEEYGYTTALTRMEPWDASPKNDIVLAWKPSNVNEKDIGKDSSWLSPNPACLVDLDATKEHLFLSCEESKSTKTRDDAIVGANETRQVNTQYSQERVAIDWTPEEKDEIRGKISDFLNQSLVVPVSTTKVGHSPPPKLDVTTSASNESVLVFPTGMGRRRRKLIHYVAEQMNLAHWTVGSKKSDKTVAVARSRPPRQKQV